MHRFSISLILTLIGTLSVCALEVPENLDYDIVRDIAVLEDGRKKPLDTYAGESIKTLTGRWNYEKNDPVGFFLSMIAFPQCMNDNLIRIDYMPVKESLGLSTEKNFFSYNELNSNQLIRQFAQKVFQKSENQEKLNRFDREIADIWHQLMLFEDIISGVGLKLVPPPEGMSEEEHGWFSITDPKGYSQETHSELKTNFQQLIAAVKSKDPQTFAQTGRELKAQLAALNPQYYPDRTQISREIYYNHSRPFLSSWIFYLIAFFMFLISFFYTNKYLYWSAFGVFIIGFYYHTLGLLLRSLVSGRPPVSNMYESVIFVGWGIILTALIFEAIYRRRWFLTISSFLGVGMLILADILPFDPNIEPLVPVLRSNYWLIVHVLTITLSYSVFALAMGLAHVVLGVYFYFPHRNDILKELSLFIYRVLQVGVILLAAGTILGGVWAAESWGRFWGWDPKETWALISLLGYLAILHARYTGWLRDFGTAVCSILGFWLILMTWYGVNFVLSAGLHSYGFGSGGGKYVIGYLLIETIFLCVVYWKYKNSPTISTATAIPAEGMAD